MFTRSLNLKKCFCARRSFFDVSNSIICQLVFQSSTAKIWQSSPSRDKSWLAGIGEGFPRIISSRNPLGKRGVPGGGGVRSDLRYSPQFSAKCDIGDTPARCKGMELSYKKMLCLFCKQCFVALKFGYLSCTKIAHVGKSIDVLKIYINIVVNNIFWYFVF